MDRCLSILDEAWPALRLGSALREHGATILFWAAGLVLVMVLSTGFELEAFPGRIVSEATLANYDIATRTALYARCLAAFAAAVIGLAWLVPRLEGVLGRTTLAIIDWASLAGLLVLYLALWRLVGWGSVGLALAFQVLAVLLAVLDSRGFDRARAADRGAEVLWLGTIAFAVYLGALDWDPSLAVSADAWWAPAPYVVAGGLALHLVRHALARGPDERARALGDRFVHALSPLAALPAIAVIHREALLVLNQRGFVEISGAKTRAAAILLLLAWIAVRAWRGPRIGPSGRLEVERPLGRLVFPWIIAGIASASRWRGVHEVSTDFLESGNPALLIQQWFDYGRWPFFETFSAHGLSDSFFGFIYFAVTGARTIVWYHYDFLSAVAGLLSIYYLTRAMFGASAPAAFVTLVLPYLEELFPDICAHALLIVLLFVWVSRRGTTLAWFVYGLCLFFTFAWRLDIAYAAVIGTAGALIALRFAVPGARLPLRPIFFGALATLGVFLFIALLAMVVRGVNLGDWLRDFKHVVTSNQAFGGVQITRRINEIYLWHTFFVPAILVALFTLMLARAWRKLPPSGHAHLVFAACAFLTFYVWANAPRGLVRHTFLEGGNAMISSFAFAVISFAPCWLVAPGSRKTIFAAFVIISSVMASVFDLNRVDGDDLQSRGNALQRAQFAAVNLPPLERGGAKIDRNPVPGWFVDNHVGALRRFLDTELDQGETFLDLSNSSNLYFHMRRVSPHWLNHLLLVYDDYGQRRVIEDLARFDVPVVLLPTTFEISQRDGAQYLGDLDGVHMRDRHYRIFEHVYANYQPWGLVQRWSVWIRRDRLQRAAPPSDDATRLWSWKRGRWTAERAEPGERSTEIAIGESAGATVPRVYFPRKSTLYLRIVADAKRDAVMDLSWTVDSTTWRRNESRQLEIGAGRHERFYVLPGDPTAREIDSLAFDAGPDVELDTLELVSCTSPVTTAVNALVDASVVAGLHHVPRLWGEHDPPPRDGASLLRTLHDAGAWPGPCFGMEIAHGGPPPFEAGFTADGQSLLLTGPGVARGDLVTFGETETRRVARAIGRVLELEEPLVVDPGSPPRVLVLYPETMQGASIQHDTVRRFAFEPLTEEEAASTYILLSMRVTTPHMGEILIDYGSGDDSAGRYTLDAPTDDRIHEYAVRVSAQYNWTRRRNTWIAVQPMGGSLDIRRVLLVRGD